MNEIHIRDIASVRRGLVADPKAKHYRKMRQALWLYLFLLMAAPPRSGRRLLDPEAIALAMGLGEATVRSWLGHLRAPGYLNLERQEGRVWIQISRWRENDQGTGPVSRDSDKAKELARTLGEPTEIHSLARVLQEYDSERVEMALNRVLAVPQSQIRKSRLALFLYFLKNNK